METRGAFPAPVHVIVCSLFLFLVPLPFCLGSFVQLRMVHFSRCFGGQGLPGVGSFGVTASGVWELETLD